MSRNHLHSYSLCTSFEWPHSREWGERQRVQRNLLSRESKRLFFCTLFNSRFGRMWQASGNNYGWPNDDKPSHSAINLSARRTYPSEPCLVLPACQICQRSCRMNTAFHWWLLLGPAAGFSRVYFVECLSEAVFVWCCLMTKCSQTQCSVTASCLTYSQIQSVGIFLWTEIDVAVISFPISYSAMTVRSTLSVSEAE